MSLQSERPRVLMGLRRRIWLSAPPPGTVFLERIQKASADPTTDRIASGSKQFRRRRTRSEPIPLLTTQDTVKLFRADRWWIFRSQHQAHMGVVKSSGPNGSQFTPSNGSM